MLVVFYFCCLSVSLFRITAGHGKLYENNIRLNSNLTENTTKLDVYQRNSYNRTNHNRQPQVVLSEPTYDRYCNDTETSWDDTTDNRRFTERRKKTVRFDGQDSSDDWTKWETERQGSQDSTAKDSGIDTSSTFTSSEDSNRGDGPKVLPTIQKKKHFYFCYLFLK